MLPPRRNTNLWHSAPGIVAAYQPQCGPDALSVRQNMAYGAAGRYAATTTNPPNWAATTGWGFDSTWLCTNVIPVIKSWSMLAKFTIDHAGLSFSCPIVAYTYTWPDEIMFGWQTWYNSAAVHSAYNGLAYNGVGQAAGVFGIGGPWAYHNGVLLGSINDYGLTILHPIYLGMRAGYDRECSCYVQNLSIYERTLTAAEVWLYSQQMAHLEYADYSVWTPARRWFFIPPPAPAAVTPVLSTIYLNTADIGDTSLFDEADGAEIDSTYARTGANSFRFHAVGAYLLANLTSNATKYARFGLLASNVPPATARICAWLENGMEHVSLWLSDGLELQMRQGSTVIQTSPTTLEPGIWYCIEAKVVVHTTTGRFQVRIDGVDDMSAIGICTDADVDGAINQIQFEPPGEDVCIDDIMVREDQWCGTGGVYVVIPIMDGTVKDWPTGDYTAIVEIPPTFSAYIEDSAGGSHTQLVRHSGVGDLDINVVGVFALGRIDASADVTFQAAARSILTDNVGYAQDLDTIGVYARLLMTTDPNGTVAWTVHAVNNALQLGVKS